VNGSRGETLAILLKHLLFLLLLLLLTMMTKLMMKGTANSVSYVACVLFGALTRQVYWHQAY